MITDILIIKSRKFQLKIQPLKHQVSTVFKQSLDEQIHIELNSITILFHPCGLLRYCDYFSMISKKVNVDGDEMSWY